jgi:hypothetical protein
MTEKAEPNITMNAGSTKKCCCYLIPALAVLGTFLIVGWLVWLMIGYTKPASVGQARAEERKKILAEMHAAEAQALENVGWQDQAKGLVRLPIERAKQLTIQEWKNPAAGRSNLLARVEKANAAPPKAPEKPSEFE